MDRASELARIMKTGIPRRLKTTLCDLVRALQDVAEPDEDTLVVDIVARWLRTGRITFLRNATQSVRDDLL
jgi:hypothetical protein